MRMERNESMDTFHEIFVEQNAVIHLRFGSRHEPVPLGAFQIKLATDVAVVEKVLHDQQVLFGGHVGLRVFEHDPEGPDYFAKGRRPVLAKRVQSVADVIRRQVHERLDLHLGHLFQHEPVICK